MGLVFGDWGLMFEIWGLEYVAYGRKNGDSFTCFASCLQTQKGAKTSPKKTETAWAAAAAAAAAAAVLMVPHNTLPPKTSPNHP